MIRKCVSAALVAVAIMAVAAPSAASLFQLKAGESVVVGRDGFTVGFDRIVSDSRCAIGLLCVWEGDATVSMWAQSNSHQKVEFVLHSHAFFQQSAEFHGYTISLVKVDPYPVYGYPTPPAAYSVTFAISGELAPVEQSTWGRIKGLFVDR